MFFDHSVLKKTLCGIFTIFIVILLYFFIKFLHYEIYNSTSNGFYLNLRANYVNTLKKGDAVLFAGTIPLGFVVDIYPENYELNVKVFLQNSAKSLLKKDSNTVFHVLSETFLGSKYVNVYFRDTLSSQGLHESLFFENEDIWPLGDAVALERIQESMNVWLESHYPNQDILISSIAEKFEATLMDLKELQKTSVSDINYLRSAYVDLMNLNIKYIEDIKINYRELSSYVENLSLPKNLDIVHVLNIYDNVSQELVFLFSALETTEGNIDLFVKRKSQLKRQLRLITQYAEELITCIKNNPKVLVLQKRCTRIKH